MHACASPNNKVARLTSVFISNELNLGVYCRILWNSRRTQQTPFCAICTLHSVEQFVVYRSQIFPKFKLKADTGVCCRNIAVINLVWIEGIRLLLTGKQSCQCHACKEQYLRFNVSPFNPFQHNTLNATTYQSNHAGYRTLCYGNQRCSLHQIQKFWQNYIVSSEQLCMRCCKSFTGAGANRRRRPLNNFFSMSKSVTSEQQTNG